VIEKYEWNGLHLETKSDSNEMHADDSNIDGESDNETNTSMKIESKPFISQGLIAFFFFLIFDYDVCLLRIIWITSSCCCSRTKTKR
jgi:hypothetical protein